MNADQQRAHLALLGRDHTRIVEVGPEDVEALRGQNGFIPVYMYARCVPLPDEVGCIGGTAFVVRS